MAIDKKLKNLDTKAFGKVIMETTKPELYSVAQKIEKELEQKSKEAIDYFYADYEPKHYNRVFSMGSKSTPYLFKSHIKENNNGYSIIFDYSATNMTGEHRCTNDLIFEQAFLEGFHGGYNGEITLRNGAIIDVPARSTPPWEIVMKYINSTYPM